MDLQELNASVTSYEEGPAILIGALRDVGKAAQKWRPDPAAWSVHEIICHCADSETYAAIRLRLLLAEPEPLIVGYDQVNWATYFDYHSLPIEPSLDAIKSVRANTVPLVRKLTKDDLRKIGRHTESGRYSVEDWLKTYRSHLHDHAEQIRDNLKLWNASNQPAD